MAVIVNLDFFCIKKLVKLRFQVNAKVFKGFSEPLPCYVSHGPQSCHIVHMDQTFVTEVNFGIWNTLSFF